jgi:hypothetical protein
MYKSSQDFTPCTRRQLNKVTLITGNGHTVYCIQCIKYSHLYLGSKGTSPRDRGPNWRRQAVAVLSNLSSSHWLRWSLKNKYCMLKKAIRLHKEVSNSLKAHRFKVWEEKIHCTQLGSIHRVLWIHHTWFLRLFHKFFLKYIFFNKQNWLQWNDIWRVCWGHQNMTLFIRAICSFLLYNYLCRCFQSAAMWS